VPVAAAQQVTRGFRGTMALAMGLGVLSAGVGVWLAGEADTAAGATIVVLAIGGFVAIAAGAAAWRLLRRRAQAIPHAADVEPPDVVLER
jgi:zinc transport system permease protein